MKIVLTSFTPATAGGGVPRWCRDLKAGFAEGEVVHYSWTDVVKAMGQDENVPEWSKARILGMWLVKTKKLLPEDILIGDGFWASSAQTHPTEKTVQVAHGNWSHTTLSDVEKGIPPEFPQHHEAQLRFRKLFADLGGRSVAVSDFIAHQCKLQWGFNYPVINNGIDLNKFCPPSSKIPRKRPVIVHGVTNGNKGFDHVKLLEKELHADVLLLDDAARFFNSMQSEWKTTKYQALAQADLVVVPSAHEGNSYFVLESLSSDVPIVAYDVGLMWKAKTDKIDVGIILDRDQRNPEKFLEGVNVLIQNRGGGFPKNREWVSQFSLQNFQSEWRSYLQKEFGFVSKAQ